VWKLLVRPSTSVAVAWFNAFNDAAALRRIAGFVEEPQSPMIGLRALTDLKYL